MDIFAETKAPLVQIWEDNRQRQGAKLVLLQAIANATDVSVKQADEIFYELDQMLLKEEEAKQKRQEKGL